MHKLLIVFCLSLNACGILKEPSLQQLSSGNYGYLKDYMTAFIEQEMGEQSIPGLSIALVDKQKIIWSRGFGFADREKQIKATDKTIYRAGSISKIFTALAVMQLAEQKKLDIEQPLVRSLPEFKIKSRFGSTDSITLKTILTHHSGLPADVLDGFAGESIPHFSSVVNKISDYYVAYPTNKIFSYSNLGFTLAGHAVEKVSQQSYQQYMNEKLLFPLDMLSSNFSGKVSADCMAQAYLNNELIEEPALRDLPAGGLNTNVFELSNLLKMINALGVFNGKQILKPETLKALLLPQNRGVPLDLGKRIGLSLFFMDDYLGKEYTVVGHDGQTIAHNALIVTAPKLKFGLVVLANSIGEEGNSLEKIAKKIMRLMFAIKTGSAFKMADFESLPKTEKPFKDFSAYYASELGLVEINGTPDQYDVEVMGKSLSLIKEQNNLYALEYKLFGFIPITLSIMDKMKIYPLTIAGHQLLIANVDGMPYILAEKIVPKGSQKAWDKRLGEYIAINPSKIEIFRIETVQLKRSNGFYIAELKGAEGELQSYPVSPMNDNELLIMGLGRGLGETINVYLENGADIIEYQGLLFKRLKN